MNVAAKASLMMTALLLAGCGGDLPADTSETSAAAEAAGVSPATSPVPSPTPTAELVLAEAAPAPSAAPGPATGTATGPSCKQVPRNGRLFPEAPVPVAPEFAAFVGPGDTRLAVSTLAGKTICVDLYGIQRLSRMAVTKDGRFLTFSWIGYEADGYKVIDRAGPGTVLETGARPSFSPSRQRFLAAQMSEAAFGGLEGIGVWDIGPRTSRQIVTITREAPRGTAWRVERWVGEDCAVLSMIPMDSLEDRRERIQLRLTGKEWTLAALPAGLQGCDTA